MTPVELSKLWLASRRRRASPAFESLHELRERLCLVAVARFPSPVCSPARSQSCCLTGSSALGVVAAAPCVFSRLLPVPLCVIDKHSVTTLPKTTLPLDGLRHSNTTATSLVAPILLRS